MAQAEQAETASETIDDLAQFLADNPDADGSGPAKEVKAQNSDDPEEDQSEEDEENPAEEEDEESESEEPEKQSSLKFKVPVKGEDGTDTTIEVDEKELVAGYQRHSDYTRKTQDLANKEREVTQAVVAKLNEGQNYYIQQAQMAQAAVRQLAGLRTPEEMAQLAVNEPALWVQEQQRQAAINNVLTRLEQGMQQETAQQAAQRQQMKTQAYQQTWEVLRAEGIDKPALAKIFDTMRSKYRVTDDRLALVDDPVLVRIMRDAAAYQELKDKKSAVVKKVQDAPKLPAQRQSVPRNEQLNKKLNQRFASGRAKLDDLAAYLSANNL